MLRTPHTLLESCEFYMLEDLVMIDHLQVMNFRLETGMLLLVFHEVLSRVM